MLIYLHFYHLNVPLMKELHKRDEEVTLSGILLSGLLLFGLEILVFSFIFSIHSNYLTYFTHLSREQ